jgi:hypothetical protein
MFNSVQLLYFREEDYSLHLLARDFDMRMLLHTELIIDGTKVGFVTSDDSGHIHLFQHNPR